MALRGTFTCAAQLRGTLLGQDYLVNRSRNSRHSDTRLPADPSRYRPLVAPPPAPTPLPPGVLVGEAPEWDTGTLEHFPTAEVLYSGSVAVSAGAEPVLYFVYDPSGIVTMHPTSGAFTATAPSAAIYEFDVIAYNAYGVALETLTLDAT